METGTVSNPRWASVAGAILLTFWMAAPSVAQSPTVIGVVPEGIVVDAASFPDLRPGARMGFRRPDGSAGQVGEGWVLDVREGRALVGVKPGGSVQAGDLAFSCASLTGPGSQTDLRASVQGLKAQLSSPGSGSAELQTVIAQLESTLDAREAAIRGGSCDVAPHDQQIAALSQQLQQTLAAPSATAPSTGGAQSAPPGQESATAPPPPGATGSEGMATALQFLQQIFQMAQSMGLGGGSTSSGGQQSSFPPPSQGIFPTDPGGQQPPPSSVPPPPPFSTPPPPSSTPPPSAIQPPPPPSSTPPPPSSVQPPPSSTPPPPSGAPTTDGPGKAPPSGGRTITRPPASGQWWTITPPKQTAPTVGAVPGNPSGSTGGAGTAPGTTTPPTSGAAPGLRLPPGTTPVPGIGPSARVPPAPQRLAVVQGVVRADNGVPVPGAIIIVGGRQVVTNAHGVFLVDNVPLGRQVVVASARGFVQGRVAVDLSSGEVEKVNVILRRTGGLPLQAP